MPLVYVAVFIEQATPFMEEFLDRLVTLNYPLDRLRLFIHNNVRGDPGRCLLPPPLPSLTHSVVEQVVYHEHHIQRFWERHRSAFPDATLVGPEENLQEDKARNMAV